MGDSLAKVAREGLSERRPGAREGEGDYLGEECPGAQEETTRQRFLGGMFLFCSKNSKVGGREGGVQ